MSIETVETITANALDLSGGELIRGRLDAHFAVLTVLNVLDTMMLELANANISFRPLKQKLVLAANKDYGSVSGSALGDKFVRYRETPSSSWQILDVVQTVEDLTRATAESRRAILFAQDIGAVSYLLSFTPTSAITCELWRKKFTEEVEDLRDDSPLPKEFNLLCAYRSAEMILDQLLIIDAKNYQAFVIARKGSIKTDRDRNEFIWRKFRANPPDASSPSKVKPYEPMDNYGEVFDDTPGEFFI